MPEVIRGLLTVVRKDLSQSRRGFLQNGIIMAVLLLFMAMMILFSRFSVDLGPLLSVMIMVFITVIYVVIGDFELNLSGNSDNSKWHDFICSTPVGAAGEALG